MEQFPQSIQRDAIKDCDLSLQHIQDVVHHPCSLGPSSLLLLVESVHEYLDHYKHELPVATRVELLKKFHDVLVDPNNSTARLQASCSRLIVRLANHARNFTNSGEFGLPWMPSLKLIETYILEKHSSFNFAGPIASTSRNGSVLQAVKKMRKFFSPHAYQEIFDYLEKPSTSDIGFMEQWCLLCLLTPAVSHKSTPTADVDVRSHVAMWVLSHWLEQIDRMPGWDAVAIDFLSRFFKHEWILHVSSQPAVWSQPEFVNHFSALLPQLFTRVLQLLNLAASSQGGLPSLSDATLPLTLRALVPSHGATMSNVAKIVAYTLGMSTMNAAPDEDEVFNHTSDLLRVVQTFFHPSNAGPWTHGLSALLAGLGKYTAKRLRYELDHSVPSTGPHKEQLIDIMQPILLLALHSKSPMLRRAAKYALADFASASVLLQGSSSRPSSLVHGLLERSVSGLQDAMDEPHRTVIAFDVISALTRSMLIESNSQSPEAPPVYPPVLVELLRAVLPAIDVCDEEKTRRALVAMYTTFMWIPSHPSKHSISDMLDQFLDPFFDRVFRWLKDKEADSKSLGVAPSDSAMHRMMAGTIPTSELLQRVVGLVAQGMDDAQHSRIMRRIKAILSSDMHEMLPSMADVVKVVSAVSSVQPQQTLMILQPLLIDGPLAAYQNSRADDSSNSMIRILAHILKVAGAAMLPYIASIKQLLHATVLAHAKDPSSTTYTTLPETDRDRSRACLDAGQALLSGALKGLTRCYPTRTSYSSAMKPADVPWHEPSLEELRAAHQLLHDGLLMPMRRLKQTTKTLKDDQTDVGTYSVVHGMICDLTAIKASMSSLSESMLDSGSASIKSDAFDEHRTHIDDLDFNEPLLKASITAMTSQALRDADIDPEQISRDALAFDLHVIVGNLQSHPVPRISDIRVLCLDVMDILLNRVGTSQVHLETRMATVKALKRLIGDNFIGKHGYRDGIDLDSALPRSLLVERVHLLYLSQLQVKLGLCAPHSASYRRVLLQDVSKFCLDAFGTVRSRAQRLVMRTIQDVDTHAALNIVTCLLPTDTTAVPGSDALKGFAELIPVCARVFGSHWPALIKVVSSVVVFLKANSSSDTWMDPRVTMLLARGVASLLAMASPLPIVCTRTCSQGSAALVMQLMSGAIECDGCKTGLRVMMESLNVNGSDASEQNVSDPTIPSIVRAGGSEVASMMKLCVALSMLLSLHVPCGAEDKSLLTSILSMLPRGVMSASGLRDDLLHVSGGVQMLAMSLFVGFSGAETAKLHEEMTGLLNIDDTYAISLINNMVLNHPLANIDADEVGKTRPGGNMAAMIGSLMNRMGGSLGQLGTMAQALFAEHGEQAIGAALSSLGFGGGDQGGDAAGGMGSMGLLLAQQLTRGVAVAFGSGLAKQGLASAQLSRWPAQATTHPVDSAGGQAWPWAAVPSHAWSQVEGGSVAQAHFNVARANFIALVCIKGGRAITQTLSDALARLCGSNGTQEGSSELLDRSTPAAHGTFAEVWAGVTLSRVMQEMDVDIIGELAWGMLSVASPDTVVEWMLAFRYVISQPPVSPPVDAPKRLDGASYDALRGYLWRQTRAPPSTLSSHDVVEPALLHAKRLRLLHMLLLSSTDGDDQKGAVQESLEVIINGLANPAALVRKEASECYIRLLAQVVARPASQGEAVEAAVDSVLEPVLAILSRAIRQIPAVSALNIVGERKSSSQWVTLLHGLDDEALKFAADGALRALSRALECVGLHSRIAGGVVVRLPDIIPLIVVGVAAIPEKDLSNEYRRVLALLSIRGAMPGGEETRILLGLADALRRVACIPAAVGDHAQQTTHNYTCLASVIADAVRVDTHKGSVDSGLVRRLRMAALSFTQLILFQHRFFWATKDAACSFHVLRPFLHIVTCLLADPWPEVAELASDVLSQCVRNLSDEWVAPIVEQLVALLASGKGKRRQRKGAANTNERSAHNAKSTMYHVGLLGLCACIKAHPYDIAGWMPHTAALVADQAQSNTAASRAIADFRRTHQDSWRHDRLLFSEEDIEIIETSAGSDTFFV